MPRLILFAVVVFLTTSNPLLADSHADKLARKPDAWFASQDAKAALNSILSWQTDYGDWPKNLDTTKRPFSGVEKKPTGTFDNGATTGELRALARAFRVSGDARYKNAFLKGFDHILKAQYPHGGWPQFYPLSKNYHRHVTFNDGSMVRLLEFLRDASSGRDFAFIDNARRAAAKQAIAKGIDCIIECQVVVDGVPTVWCAQHHAQSLQPVKGRSYEHPSLSGSESVGILLFLMDIDEPSPEIIRAVKAGAAWIESAKIEGYRYQKIKKEPTLIKDSKARPLWARFYEIQTGRPIFSDRDGVIKYDIKQIGTERRQGYAWYGHWGEILAKELSKWPHR